MVLSKWFLLPLEALHMIIPVLISPVIVLLVPNNPDRTDGQLKLSSTLAAPHNKTYVALSLKKVPQFIFISNQTDLCQWIYLTELRWEIPLQKFAWHVANWMHQAQAPLSLYWQSLDPISWTSPFSCVLFAWDFSVVLAFSSVLLASGSATVQALCLVCWFSIQTKTALCRAAIWPCLFCLGHGCCNQLH